MILYVMGGGPAVVTSELPGDHLVKVRSVRKGGQLLVFLPSKDLFEKLTARRHLLLLIFDGMVWIGAVGFATLARLDFDLNRVPVSATVAVAVFAAVVFSVAAWVSRLHDGRAPLGSLDDMIRLGVVCAGVGLVVFVLNFFALDSLVPRSVPVIATFCALVVMAWGRAVARWVRDERWTVRRGRSGAQPVLVIGAGPAGRQLIRSMHSDPDSQWRPVGLLDDNIQRRYLRIDGVPVIGQTQDMVALAAKNGVSTVVVAIPGAEAALLRRLSRSATAAKLTVKVLPGVNEVLGPRIGIRDVRDIDLPDLLGRRQIDTDVQSVAGYLTGQRVLVTGAGGSIGSELCRQITRWNPAELIMLDRDESALHAVQLTIDRCARLDSPDVVLADIRDSARVHEIFEQRRPQIVFHAAALKHLPMLELYPDEAVKTNIWGTLTVLRAARSAGVERFVNISTDKAANPISVLGYSKRIAEGLTAAVAADCGRNYLSVRFGNVLGSRGSVLTAFAAQIAAGGPVTVTHPDVTRYFMTVDEAVQLVIQAAVTGGCGEALVLDMGDPVKIDDVARHLIDLSGENIEISYTGLRSGEKMHEELFSDGEPDHRPVHALVSHVDVPLVEPGTIRSLTPGAGKRFLIAELEQICRYMSTEVDELVTKV
jgi:FlaA1/EpsC-like NDP-sugar epimerase